MQNFKVPSKILFKILKLHFKDVILYNMGIQGLLDLKAHMHIENIPPNTTPTPTTPIHPSCNLTQNHINGLV